MTTKSSLASDSTTWKLHREVVLLAGWGRAILLQIAHPLVAQGVADHSGFAAERWARVGRLKRTVEAMLALTFGTPEESAAAAAGINRIHDRVHGRLPSQPARSASGSGYSAHDPALLAWVHVTLVDTFLVTYERFVGPLSPAERDRYCRRGYRRRRRCLGMKPDALPRTAAELSACMERMLASDEIAVTDTARRLADEIVSRALPWPARPLLALARLPTVGLLPAPIREAYGFEWTPRQERALRLLSAATRRSLPFSRRFSVTGRPRVGRRGAPGLRSPRPRALREPWRRRAKICPVREGLGHRPAPENPGKLGRVPDRAVLGAEFQDGLRILGLETW